MEMKLEQTKAIIKEDTLPVDMPLITTNDFIGCPMAIERISPNIFILHLDVHFNISDLNGDYTFSIDKPFRVIDYTETYANKELLCKLVVLAVQEFRTIIIDKHPQYLEKLHFEAIDYPQVLSQLNLALAIS